MEACAHSLESLVDVIKKFVDFMKVGPLMWCSLIRISQQ